jgi:hypothetical protein
MLLGNFNPADVYKTTIDFPPSPHPRTPRLHGRQQRVDEYTLSTVYNSQRGEFLVTWMQNPSDIYGRIINPETRIRYTLPEAGRVCLKVFDLLDREVTTLVDGNRTAGNHTVVWNGTFGDGTPASSGIYISRFEYSIGDRSIVKNNKMILVR